MSTLDSILEGMKSHKSTQLNFRIEELEDYVQAAGSNIHQMKPIINYLADNVPNLSPSDEKALLKYLDITIQSLRKTTNLLAGLKMSANRIRAGKPI